MGRRKGTTLAEAKKTLGEHGIVIRHSAEFNEYRVNFRGGAEATAYYTNDIVDAIATGTMMLKGTIDGTETWLPGRKRG